jgi:thiosulfate/3-mercaptopyruvate sulfurtransferase
VQNTRNFDCLISAVQLSNRLDDNALRVYDCRFSLFDKEKGYSAYLSGHIPGASYVHLENDLSGPVTPRTGRHPRPNVDLFIERLGALGLEHGSKVVIYDEGPSAQAARFWWLLRWVGHENVAVLDGGFRAWESVEGPVTQGIEAYPPGRYSAQIGSFESVEADDVAEAVSTKSRLVIDARENKRFVGKEEPLDRIAGHIPGSINRPFQSNLESGIFKSAGQLREEFEELISGRRPHEVIHTCGSGVTACHNLLAMEHCGLSGSKLYVGSWSDWITDPTRPIVGKDGVE